MYSQNISELLLTGKIPTEKYARFESLFTNSLPLKFHWIFEYFLFVVSTPYFHGSILKSLNLNPSNNIHNYCIQ